MRTKRFWTALAVTFLALAVTTAGVYFGGLHWSIDAQVAAGDTGLIVYSDTLAVGTESAYVQQSYSMAVGEFADFTLTDTLTSTDTNCEYTPNLDLSICISSYYNGQLGMTRCFENGVLQIESIGGVNELRVTLTPHASSCPLAGTIIIETHKLE